MITEYLEIIKEHTGLNLTLCPYFFDVKMASNGAYFNVLLNDRISESNDYNTLKRFADKYNMIRIEPNGLKRLAIFMLLDHKKIVTEKIKAQFDKLIPEGNFDFINYGGSIWRRDNNTHCIEWHRSTPEFILP